MLPFGLANSQKVRVSTVLIDNYGVIFLFPRFVVRICGKGIEAHRIAALHQGSQILNAVIAPNRPIGYIALLGINLLFQLIFASGQVIYFPN